MKYGTLKRLFDVAAAGCALVLGAPLFLLIALLIWLEDERPVLFSQRRPGRNGRLFRLYKFRSLRRGPHDAKNPRTHTTRMGRWLRRHALDEMPQLWNVLRGDMSIVGPRPVLPAEARGYDDRQRRRLRVRPGLTGWAQIHGRNRLSWQKRIERDLWYVDHVSFGLDARILLRTPRIVLSGDGAYGPGNHDPDEAEVVAQRRPSPSSHTD